MNNTEISMQMILRAGNATNCAYRAMMKAKAFSFDEAKTAMEEAEEELKAAHVEQTKLLQQFAQGVNAQSDILLTHAMDHLTMANVNMKMAYEMVDLYEYLNELKKGEV